MNACIRSFLLKGSPFLLFLGLLSSCRTHVSHTGNVGAGDSIDHPTFFPVETFLEAQVKKVEALSVDPMQYSMHNGKRDSGTIKTSSVRALAAPFLSSSFGDSGSGGKYTESTFADSAHHRLVFSYEARGDSIPLNKVDVYVDPGSNRIRQVYMQYMIYTPDSSIRKQLIWVADSSFTLISSVDKHEYTADLRKQKVVWGQHP